MANKERGHTPASKWAMKKLDKLFNKKEQKSQAGKVTQTRKQQNKIVNDSFYSKFK